MATIKFMGMELQTISECIVFDKPRNMLVWNSSFNGPIERLVCAVIPYRSKGSVIATDGVYQYCAEIPEKPAPRRATNRELAKWLAEGKGQADLDCTIVGCLATEFRYYKHHDKEPVNAEIRVRKWGDSDWHEPTVDYMGIEEK